MRTWIVFIVFLLVWSTPICAFTIVTFLHFLEAVVLAARKLVSTFSFEGWHSVFFLQFCAAFVTQGTLASVSFFECVLASHEATISTTVNVDCISLEFQSHVIPVHFSLSDLPTGPLVWNSINRSKWSALAKTRLKDYISKDNLKLVQLTAITQYCFVVVELVVKFWFGHDSYTQQ